MNLDQESVIRYLIDKFKMKKKDNQMNSQFYSEDHSTVVPFYFITNYLTVNNYFTTLSVFLEEARINIENVKNQYIPELSKLDSSLGYFYELKTADCFFKSNAFSTLKLFFKNKKKLPSVQKEVQTNFSHLNSDEIDLKLKKIEDRYIKKMPEAEIIRKDTLNYLTKNNEDLRDFQNTQINLLKQKLAFKISLEKKLNNTKRNG
jgi:ATP-dependent helicase YprA (DUF1998 family)